MSWRHYPPVERAGYHLARARAWGRRATLPGLSLRAALWLLGLTGLLLAMPWSSWLGPVLPVAAGLALLPAVAPGGGWVTAVQLLAIGTVAVRVATPASDPPLPVLLLLGAVLYAHHTAAALADQLRTDAVVPPAVLRHWAGRAGLVVAGSALLGLAIAVLAGSARPGRDTGYLAAGVAAAVGVAAVATWLRHRRSAGSGG
jgi:hypothetical protein